MRAPLALRDAGRADAPAVAALHAASWRTAYRGILADAYLDGPVDADRLELWHGRLAAPSPRRITLLAEADGALAGFACCFVDEDPRWGSLIDNLHAAPDRRGRGIGRALLREAAVRLEERAPDRPVHLWCLDDNAPAMAFHRRVGGTAADRDVTPERGGTTNAVTRVVWPSPEALAAGCG